MKRILAAALLASVAAICPTAALAQDAAEQPLATILQGDLAPETQEIAMKLAAASGISRTFDEVLPLIAEQTKNAFIQSNPDMQLGIISIVDKVAVEMVSRRPELDNYLARVWASGFTPDEMEELLEFYETDAGKKFARTLPRLLAVQTAAAQEWGQAVAEDMRQRVTEELRTAMSAEQRALEGDIAGPPEEPAPQQ